MNKQTRIFLAGHTGMVGSALFRRLDAMGYRNLILRSHNQVDLTDQSATLQLFRDEMPEVVLLAAAKVGGIYANSSAPAEFLAGHPFDGMRIDLQSMDLVLQLFLGLLFRQKVLLDLPQALAGLVVGGVSWQQHVHTPQTDSRDDQ